MRTTRVLHILSLLGAGVLAACGDSTAPKSTARPVSLSLTTRASGTAAFGLARSPMQIGVTIGGGDVVITKAQLVLRDVKLEGTPTGSAACTARDSAETERERSDSAATEPRDSSGRSGSGAAVMSAQGADDSVSETEHQECGEMRLGPVLLDLPIDSTVTAQVASVPLPEGSYREMKFHLHTPNRSSARDSAFIVANPAFADASVRIEGTYRGQAFTWTSPVNAELKMEFSPPFVVAAGGSNVTLSIDVRNWFSDGNGGTIDPSTAAPGGSNFSRVESNIRDSFRAFHDEDRDGRDDTTEHSGGSN